MKPVEFHFDFGSPNAYLAHVVIPRIAQRTGARFEYVPILLGGIFKLTNNRSPVESFAGVRNKLEYQRLEIERFVRKHRISTFRWNPFFPINTLTLMRGAVAARRIGVFERYVDLVFDNVWSRAQKMDEIEVIRGVLVSGGIDVDALLDLTQEATVKQELIANTERSVQRGAFGAPTFFVEDEMFFGKDRLAEVEDAIIGATASSTDAV
jgi:2-hydroxychromene-2-carboxylate isomerase